MRILIIANARWKGGLSGGDNIYLNFAKHWNESIQIWDMMNIDFKPFCVCYSYRVILACICALFWKETYNRVYSSSDFLMDTLPAWILLKKRKVKYWVAGFYLFAPKQKKLYVLSQKVAYFFIKKYADVVCITNDSMKHAFEDKHTVSVHGGVDLSLAGVGNKKRIYDAVFIGRLHYTKGLLHLHMILKTVVEKKPDFMMAIIGDGDMGLTKAMGLFRDIDRNVRFFGYLDSKRFDIYKQSKMVLYPVPQEHDHFSMSPVEAMACGCPMVAFDIPVMKYMTPEGTLLAGCINDFADKIIEILDVELVSHYLSKRAVEWSKAWDWNYNALRVWNEVEHGIQK